MKSVPNLNLPSEAASLIHIAHVFTQHHHPVVEFKLIFQWFLKHQPVYCLFLLGLLTPLTRHRFSVNSRTSQSMSKPSTPLLSSHRRAAELCLSPPCARHFRSASQQHSRTSSISSVARIPAMQSDPELLYDKPRSLNAAMIQATLENTGTHEAGGTATTFQLMNHYDTPRRVLKHLTVADAMLNADSSIEAGKNFSTNSDQGFSKEINALYATVEKPKKKKVNAQVAEEGPRLQAEVVVTHKAPNQWPDYIEMQPLPYSPTVAFNGENKVNVPERCLAPVEQCSRPCSLSAGGKNQSWANQLYQNSVWMQLEAEGAHATYQNPISFRSLYPKSGHGTLPLIHRNNAIDGVHLRLRRSASMPCRQVDCCISS